MLNTIPRESVCVPACVQRTQKYRNDERIGKERSVKTAAAAALTSVAA